ncbi:hypothetical protein PSR30_16830 [Pectobacterium carotovorum subsp. carotovorum]|uniref:DUF7674 family protein n=1 Tax=Pectobacterium carotovorum TaxID=554 RepID=UPI002366ED01|nr:hypothetical protein [Pectobacterium carotovorum]WDF98042.1 hypothetical protein PSR30_16830 [Pectobacterium carotovorum subsp. carotovorum]
MKKNELVSVLREKFPLFSQANDDDDMYLLYGSFGSFFIDLINFQFINKCEPRNYFYGNVEVIYKNKELIDKEIENIFLFIDDVYLNSDCDVRDVLNTCVFEAMMGNDFSYNLARKFLSKETYNHYLEITKRVV